MNLSGLILFKILRWKEEYTVERPKKCVICVAPHTSNMDFFIAKLYYLAIGRQAGFLMKEEWFFWPLGYLLRFLGGIPVPKSSRKRDGNTESREKGKSGMTERIAQAARASERFEFAITPEGTRSLNKKWKRGFYHIAKAAELPIVLYKLDYKHKTIYCSKILKPGEDMERDWREIMEYYSDAAPLAKYPEKFATDEY